MPPRTLFAVPLALALWLPGGGEGRARAEAPRGLNVVLILVDDLGWRDLGCYGSPCHDTPHVDSLAARGVRFTNAYVAAPVCSPTRASILTGKYPARLHLTDWLPGRADRPSQKLLRPKIRQHLPLEEVTLAEAFKANGYSCGCVGKWHLGGEGYGPTKQGFDVNVGGTAAGSPPGGYFAFKTPTLKLREGEYLTDRLTDEAEKFIRDHRTRPFFLYLAHYAVHIPLQPRKDLLAKYRTDPRLRGGRGNPYYAAMVASVDQSVGRVVKTLEALRLADRTVVVVTSDNGGLSVREGLHTPATSNAPLRAGKGYLYEGGLRVPLIVCGPGAKKGHVTDFPACSIDLYPTLLDLAGARKFAGGMADGFSLVTALRGTDARRRKALFWHYPHYSNQGGKPSGAVREGDYKLIEFYEDGRRELYDLKEDAGEKHDLAGKMPAKVKEMRGLLRDWRKDIGAQMPTPNPAYRE